MKRSQRKLISRPQELQNPRQELLQQQLSNAPTRVGVLSDFWAPREYNGRMPPQWLTDVVTERGGVNRYGEPEYRLVWAPDRLTPVGGTFKDWPEGSTAAERLTNAVKPLRIVVEVRLKRRYPAAGDIWVLERWLAPELAYGSPERWYSPISKGGTMILVRGANDGSSATMVPSLGAYPAEGDYEYTGSGYSEYELSEAAVAGAIGKIEQHLQTLPPIGIRIANSCRAAQAEEDLLDIQMRAEAELIVAETQPAFSGNPMVGYGKKKRHSMIGMAEKAGIYSHPGVS